MHRFLIIAMNIIKTPIEGLLVIEPMVFKDARGYFVETYNEKRYREAGIDAQFVQDNQSCSSYGVVRVRLIARRSLSAVPWAVYWTWRSICAKTALHSDNGIAWS